MTKPPSPMPGNASARPRHRKRADHSPAGAGTGPVSAEPITTASDSSGAMRIAKAMARAGLCSRREAERWIADGRVTVNGKLLKTPALEVTPLDRVQVDGKPLPSVEPARLWRYHKPRGLVTTHADPQGRPTVFDKMPPEMPRVVSIGRLDFNTEGLLLLTNDGDLARYLELPKTGWVRRYRVRAMGRVNQSELDALKDGVVVEGIAYGPVEASIDSVQAANMWLTIAIREGKNREVRKILSHLGLTVNRLIRTSFGPFQLLDLSPGGVEVVKRRVLAEQLGVKVAQELGLSESLDERKARHERGRAGVTARETGEPQRGQTGDAGASRPPKPRSGAKSKPQRRPRDGDKPAMPKPARTRNAKPLNRTGKRTDATASRGASSRGASSPTSSSHKSARRPHTGSAKPPRSRNGRDR